MSFEEMIEQTLRKVLREELPRMLAADLPRMLAADPDRLIGVREAAQRLGLAVATVYELAEQIKIPSVKLGKALRFKTGDVDAYANARRRGPDDVARLAGNR
jgi:excisionase family DNA binding protein